MLEVINTTDKKYIGLVASIDPRNPPEVITIGDGTKFEPIEWKEIEAGIWRIRNSNYTVWAREI